MPATTTAKTKTPRILTLVPASAISRHKEKINATVSDAIEALRVATDKHEQADDAWIKAYWENLNDGIVFQLDSTDLCEARIVAMEVINMVSHFESMASQPARVF